MNKSLMDVKYDLIIIPDKKLNGFGQKIRPFFFFVRFCDNVSCVSLGRAHWPRAGVAARGPEGLVRKSGPPDTGSHSNYSNQHSREQRGWGWWPQEGHWVEGEGKKEVPTSQAPLMLFHPQERLNLSVHPPSPSLCCVGGRLTFPVLPGGSSPESWVILRGRQRTRCRDLHINTHSSRHSNTCTAPFLRRSEITSLQSECNHTYMLC